jgi:peptidoglycan biosynthesis protein MviN/MurJ (putative lipid II flippase)
MVFLVSSSFPIIRLLLEGGRFNEHSVQQTALALAAYSWGVVPYGLIKVLTAYYYASSRTKWPMYFSFISIAFNFILNWLFVKQFGHVGLAATASLIFFVNTAFLTFGIRRDGLEWDIKKLLSSLSWVAVASLLSGVICLVTPVDLFWRSNGGVWGRKLESGIGLSFDLLVVFVFFSLAAMAYLKLSPDELKSQILSRLRKGKRK